jgi:hypothetical protein
MIDNISKSQQTSAHLPRVSHPLDHVEQPSGHHLHPPSTRKADIDHRRLPVCAKKLKRINNKNQESMKSGRGGVANRGFTF